MPGPIPKDPRLRQRRNRVSTAATLSIEGSSREAPALPEGHPWKGLTLAWWSDVWQSPMASEFLDSDRHGLYILAELVDRFWDDPDPKLAAEIRMQRQCFGLTPIDRRRLQWEVGRAESAARRGSPASLQDAKDPRGVLGAVQ